MSNTKDTEHTLNGEFSLSLSCLKAHIDCLLEGIGGVHAQVLLDSLGKLNTKNQDILIPVLIKVIEKIANSQLNLDSDNDNSLHQLEDELFEDILKAITLNSEAKPTFQVICGGKE